MATLTLARISIACKDDTVVYTAAVREEVSGSVPVEADEDNPGVGAQRSVYTAMLKAFKVVATQSAASSTKVAISLSEDALLLYEGFPSEAKVKLAAMTSQFHKVYRRSV